MQEGNLKVSSWKESYPKGWDWRETGEKQRWTPVQRSTEASIAPHCCPSGGKRAEFFPFASKGGSLGESVPKRAGSWGFCGQHPLQLGRKYYSLNGDLQAYQCPLCKAKGQWQCDRLSIAPELKGSQQTNDRWEPCLGLGRKSRLWQQGRREERKRNVLTSVRFTIRVAGRRDADENSDGTEALLSFHMGTGRTEETTEAGTAQIELRGHWSFQVHKGIKHLLSKVTPGWSYALGLISYRFLLDAVDPVRSGRFHSPNTTCWPHSLYSPLTPVRLAVVFRVQLQFHLPQKSFSAFVGLSLPLFSKQRTDSLV